MEKLTKRELEVLGLMAQGMSNKEIMEKLCISRGTLTRHICNVYGKLGIDGATDEYSVKRLRAALWYLRNRKETKTMNYFEKIKAMSIDEMAKVLSKPVCFHCIYNKNESCNENCKKGVKQWLEQESEEE